MRVRTIAIIQARMGSTRLPGKVLADLGGESVLARVVCRLRRADLIDDIVVATTDSTADDAIISECRRLGVVWFRGSETDVLDRYYQTAGAYDAAAVVRITADCPLIDPDLVDETIRKFQNRSADYASNAIQRSYPRGLDVEVFTMVSLKLAWEAATHSHEREHVTPYFYEHPELFRLASLVGTTDYSRYRWTLDTQEDLQLLLAIYGRFANRDKFTWREVIALMEREPYLFDFNSNVRQKSLQ
jgi:spore coat polysaccharide biosynthesis protein SpsF